jgi:hypothetical protein
MHAGLEQHEDSKFVCSCQKVQLCPLWFRKKLLVRRRFALPAPPIGVEVLWNPVDRQVKTRESEAPAEPPNAGPRRE